MFHAIYIYIYMCFMLYIYIYIYIYVYVYLEVLFLNGYRAKGKVGSKSLEPGPSFLALGLKVPDR